MGVIKNSSMVCTSTKHTLGLGNLPDGETNVVLIVEKKPSRQAHIGVARCVIAYAHVVHFVISD